MYYTEILLQNIQSFVNAQGHRVALFEVGLCCCVVYVYIYNIGFMHKHVFPNQMVFKDGAILIKGP